MTYDTRPTYAQLRREALAEREARRRIAFIRNAVSRPAQMGARLFPGDAGLADRVRTAVAARRDATPHDPGMSIEQVAFHEAGHFAVAEALGLVATMAEIHGSKFGRYGWGGTAGAWERPVLESGRWGFTVDDVEREAMFTLAGPVAEHLFAIVGSFAPEPWKRGDLYSSLGEILEGCILAAYAADQRGEDRARTLDRLLIRTAEFVLDFSGQVEQIAQCLKVRRRISRYDRKIDKILESIRRAFRKNTSILSPEQTALVVSIIADAPMDITRFTEEVGR